MLIADIGLRLSYKPFEWMSWWWRIKWGDFIEVSPQISVRYSLWKREDSHLKNLKLCGLSPAELQKEIAVYWEKPFWRRWLLSFFTDIDNKIVILAYYKRCLSFRIIRKDHPVLEKRIILSEPEQRLINSLINKVKQDTTVLENYLEKYAGNTQWIEKNLDLLLTKFEKKRQKVFAKLLNKYLKELSNGYDRKSLRKKLEEEYQRMEKMLKNYIKNSCQENSIQQESSLPIEENSNQELMYVGSVTVMDKNEESYVDSNACSMDANEWLDLNEWLTLQRQTLKKMLKEELPSYDVIQSLLEKNLNRLQLLIDTQLKNHENKINEVRYRRVNYKDALDRSEFLQHRLTYFFRHCSLLFHPDKSHGDERLKLIQTELFKAFQYFAENSLERLSKGLTKLKRYIPKWKLNLDKLLEEAERDRKEFREWMDQKFSELEAENAETRKNQARMQTEINAMETEISVLTKKMNIHMFYSEAKEQGQTWQTLNYSSPRP